MATFQQQISESYDDTYATSTTNYPKYAYATFGYPGIKAPAENRAFVRFLLNIPKGSVINSAFLTLVAYSSRTNDFTTNIRYTDEDDAADFSTNPFARAVATPSVAWAVPDFVAGQPVQTPDISSLIQDFINRSNYNANNHIAIRFDKGDATAYEYMQFYQYDGNSAYAAILTVDYTPPVAVPKISYTDGFVCVLTAMLRRFPSKPQPKCIPNPSFPSKCFGCRLQPRLSPLSS